MVFSLAKIEKRRVIYTDDRLRDSPEYLMIFYRSNTFHEWMNANPHFTIRRMTIAYVYPTFNNYDEFK